MTSPTKKITKRGRPVTRKMPERMDASPEKIAEVVLRATPPKKWRYLESKREREAFPGTSTVDTSI